MMILQTVLAGLVGTALMSALMGSITRAGWANADMIRALGSLVTKTYEKAIGPGLAIHLASGMLFAVPYTMILGAFANHGFLVTIGMGALMGLAHGLVMSLILLAVVAEKHPLQQFRDAGFDVAVAHIAGHVAYGIGVGLVVATFGIDWGLTI